ncbi:MAG TPA: hypothetical protein VFA21_02395 [Pyrinomonadaceae bacterium]|jgi:hypothetical protein|nr:hypothetical protein [Pyrinomonadaceae bacterium]
MVSTTPCAAEKSKWQQLMKDLRDTQKVVNGYDVEIAGAIEAMRRAGRPAEEIAWANALAVETNPEVVRGSYQQELALRYGLRGNAQSSRLNSLAAKRADAAQKLADLDTKCEEAEAAYKKCLEGYEETRMSLCGQPRTGHGHEGEPCQVHLGPDGSCQYHGRTAAVA